MILLEFAMAPHSQPLQGLSHVPCTITLRNPASSRHGICGSLPLMSLDKR